ncbi:MAG TPA: amidohydrolase family protein [Thermoanaerobaculia bacterium]|nr:amidohydrolase family protein [Thermoanaerobaculia bacterium]
MKTVSILACLSLVLAAAAPAAPGALAPTAPTAPSVEIRYALLLSGRPAGAQTSRRLPSGEWEYHLEFNDRGRGPDEITHLKLGPGGVPASIEITGTDYFKNPVAERFAVAGGQASWKSSSEEGHAAASPPAFYIASEGAPELIAVLARALLASPGGRLPLLPAGEASAERAGAIAVKTGGGTRSVQQVVISGLGFQPFSLWLDADGAFFASHDGWSTFIRDGWQDALPQLIAAQDATLHQREAALAARLTHRPEKGLAITGAKLFDAETGESRPGTTVVVAGNRIAAVGRDGEVAIPAGAEVIDARGKALLPGLWDMHTHLSAGDGILNIAAGVTTVRDLANDIDLLLGLRKRWSDGSAIGPRVIMAGFLDGPGPYAGPTKVLVDNVAEINAAVDRYASLGYEQIKIYSSIKPELVPAIVARAKGHGLRVSGHIPAFMTAEQAVRDGYDEIQHVNFLFLNFLFDTVKDTRTPARFTEVGKHAAELDLGSEKVQAFLRLLKERHVAVDVTVNAFEGMFTDRPGQVPAGFAAVADRLPPQVRRAVLTPQGLPVPEGMDQRYRDSFQAFLHMVKALHDAGITLEAGTDSLGGFALQRELELDVEAGIPAPEVLRIATLGAARVMKHDDERGSIARGKLADMILVDGDPAAKIADIRRVVLTVKDGATYDAAELYRSIGVKPAV